MSFLDFYENPTDFTKFEDGLKSGNGSLSLFKLF